MTGTTADDLLPYHVRDTTGPPADLYFERETTRDTEDEAQARLIEELIALATSEESLDWDAVERMDNDEWDIDEVGR
jgi:hypothetical protein